MSIITSLINLDLSNYVLTKLITCFAIPNKYIHREEEKILEEAYESSKLELVMVYDRRRVGKTTMFANFICGKRAVFHVTTSTKPNQILSDMASDFSSLTMGATPAFNGFQHSSGARYT